MCALKNYIRNMRDKMKGLVLASQSPRRKELMTLLPWQFEIQVKEVEEIINLEWSPQENVKSLAMQKAQAVGKENLNQIIIGADTIVCLNGEIMGKPKDEVHAKAMLKKLSGQIHHVFTGVAILCKERRIKESFYIETKVKMQDLSDKEIDNYLQTKEPFDKAGAYGIQGYGARYIEGIEGDYYNVMGLPVHALYEKLKTLL